MFTAFKNAESRFISYLKDRSFRAPVFGYNNGTAGSSVTFPNPPNPFCQGENGQNNNGDNDLATGEGDNPDNNGGPFNVPPQGIALILEENPGDTGGTGLGNPDDIASDGIVTFSFDRTKVSTVKIGEIAVVDDINATLDINFADGTTFSETLDINEENAVSFFGQNMANLIPDKNIEEFTIQFSKAASGTSSGAISGVLFSEFEPAEPPEPEISEPSLLVGLLGLGLIGGNGLMRKQK